MQALVIDTAEKSWDESRGFQLKPLAKPKLDEAHGPVDASLVIVKMHFAGVCGSDRGL